MLRPLSASLIAAATVLTLSAGCGGDDPPPAQLTVDIEAYQFPDELSVAAGGEVVFTSADAEPHQIDLGDGAVVTDAFGSGERVTVEAPGEPATYDLICLLHPTMRGTVEVADAG